MEEETAHSLYLSLRKTDASARQKQGLGFDALEDSERRREKSGGRAVSETSGSEDRERRGQRHRSGGKKRQRGSRRERDGHGKGRGRSSSSEGGRRSASKRHGSRQSGSRSSSSDGGRRSGSRRRGGARRRSRSSSSEGGKRSGSRRRGDGKRRSRSSSSEGRKRSRSRRRGDGKRRSKSSSGEGGRKYGSRRYGGVRRRSRSSSSDRGRRSGRGDRGGDRSRSRSPRAGRRRAKHSGGRREDVRRSWSRSISGERGQRRGRRDRSSSCSSQGGAGGRGGRNVDKRHRERRGREDTRGGSGYEHERGRSKGAGVQDGRTGGSGRSARESRGDSSKQKVDYTVVIPGYDRMSTFEKMKARTKHNLDAAFKADNGTPDELGRQWTRFVFNKEAPLEEDGARPDMEFDECDNGDMRELGRNALSLRGSQAQATIDKQSARHEDAIFSASAAVQAESTQGESEAPSILAAQPTAGSTGSRLSWRDKARMHQS